MHLFLSCHCVLSDLVKLYRLSLSRAIETRDKALFFTSPSCGPTQDAWSCRQCSRTQRLSDRRPASREQAGGVGINERLITFFPQRADGALSLQRRAFVLVVMRFWGSRGSQSMTERRAALAVISHCPARFCPPGGRVSLQDGPRRARYGPSASQCVSCAPGTENHAAVRRKTSSSAEDGQGAVMNQAAKGGAAVTAYAKFPSFGIT